MQNFIDLSLTDKETDLAIDPAHWTWFNLLITTTLFESLLCYHRRGP